MTDKYGLKLTFDKDKNKSKWKDAIFLLDNTPESRKAMQRFKRVPYYLEYARITNGEDM